MQHGRFPLWSDADSLDTCCHSSGRCTAEEATCYLWLCRFVTLWLEVMGLFLLQWFLEAETQLSAVFPLSGVFAADRTVWVSHFSVSCLLDSVSATKKLKVAVSPRGERKDLTGFLKVSNNSLRECFEQWASVHQMDQSVYSELFADGSTLILQEASPDLQDQMLTLGHVTKCVIWACFMFCDLDESMDCEHASSLQPSALLLCSAAHKQSHVANVYWSTCIEKCPHSFSHDSPADTFTDFKHLLSGRSFSSGCFCVIRILKTLGEQHVCTEVSEASCPLQRNQQTVSHLSSPAASSRSSQHLKVSVWDKLDL